MTFYSKLVLLSPVRIAIVFALLTPTLLSDRRVSSSHSDILPLFSFALLRSSLRPDSRICGSAFPTLGPRVITSVPLPVLNNKYLFVCKTTNLASSFFSSFSPAVRHRVRLRQSCESNGPASHSLLLFTSVFLFLLTLLVSFFHHQSSSFSCPSLPFPLERQRGNLCFQRRRAVLACELPSWENLAKLKFGCWGGRRQELEAGGRGGEGGGVDRCLLCGQSDSYAPVAFLGSLGGYRGIWIMEGLLFLRLVFLLISLPLIIQLLPSGLLDAFSLSALTGSLRPDGGNRGQQKVWEAKRGGKRRKRISSLSRLKKSMGKLYHKQWNFLT